MFRPVFEVDLPGGARHRHSGGTWSSNPVHEVGYVGPGYYSASTGRIASAEMIASDRRSGMIMVGVGVALFILGVGWMAWRRKRGMGILSSS